MGAHDDLKKSAGSLKAATKNSPYHFAYVAKGTEGVLILGRAMPAAGAIAAAKKESGGGTATTGTCFMEGGALILETSGNPPATLAAGVKNCLSKHAGVSMQVNGRAGGKAEEEEENEEESQEQSGRGGRGNRKAEEEEREEESEEKPRGRVQGGSSKANAPKANAPKANAPKPSRGNERKAEEEEQEESQQEEKAKIAAKVKAIQPRLTAALKGQGGNAAKALFDKAASLYRENEFEEAEEELEQLDKMLKGLGK